MKVSVVMPAYNEEHYLDRSVRDVVTGMRARSDSFEVLVIENGSGDRTSDVAAHLALELPEVRTSSLSRADYGLALRTGFLAASGTVVVTFDVDYYDLDFVDRALGVLGDAPHPAIVVGSKRGHGAHDTRAWPRRFVTWTFSVMLRVAFRVQVSDTHGMKALVRARVESVAHACRFDADLFDTELVIRAERVGLGVAELPVTVTERRPSRTSISRRALRSLWLLVRLRVALWREEETAP